MGTIQIDGSTPKLTIGNATAEDALILFDGNAQDFHIGLDDTADDLVIGVGSALGTTTALAIDENAGSTFSGTVTVGVDDTGHDVKLFGATASRYWLWDESADGVVQRGTLTVGVDDTGHDVKFFGASAGSYMEWDESADELRIMGASADATTSTGKLLLATSLTDINANDVIGKIDFQAPHEAGGTDAITVAASIRAIAQATFSSSVNATDLIFYTGHSEAAAEKIRITSQNEIGIAGANYGTDGQVLTSGGAGAAVAWEDAAGGSAGIDDQTSSNDDQLTITDSAIIVNEDSDDLDFRVESNSNTHALFIDGDADSRVQVGSGTSVASASITADLQVTKANGFPAISINAFKGDDTTGALIFTKSRNATVGSSTIVTDNDPLGKILFVADDGSDYVSIGAEIKAMINGTPGGNDVPTELIFSTTADGSSNPTARLNITADGRGLSQFTAKGWVNYSSTGNSINDSHNFSSITNQATGADYLNFTNAQSSTDYVVVGSGGDDGINCCGRSAGGFYTDKIWWVSQNNINSDYVDNTRLSVVYFGDA